MPGTNATLEALIKALELVNAVKPILDGALNNEAARMGLSRDELHALTKKITGETDAITKEDISDQD